MATYGPIYMQVRALMKALKPRRTIMLRITTLAITGMLAVCVAFPAAAAKKKAVRAPSVGTYEECESKALALGMPHGQHGHMEYVRECMGGRPSSPASERR